MTEAKAKKKNAHLWVRHPDDWYVEERFATRELFKREQFPGIIWDPCCGMGHIVLEGLAAGYRAVGSDIAMRAPMATWWCGTQNFLTENFGVGAYGDSVVMNPPFRHGDPATGIEGFVRKAMSLPDVQKIAAFVPARFLWGGKRARDFHQSDAFPQAVRAYMITPRPSCPPGPVWLYAPEEVGGGAEEFAWIIWEKNDTTGWWGDGEAPRLYWITGER